MCVCCCSGGLPFPAGFTTSMGAYNMLQSKARPSSSSGAGAGADRLGVWLGQGLAWFRQRPILALVSFIGLLLCGSVLLPFAILHHAFSRTGGGGIGLSSPSSGAPDQLLLLTSSRGAQDAFKAHLQEALGIERLPPHLQKLVKHNAQYAARDEAADAAGVAAGVDEEQQPEQQQVQSAGSAELSTPAPPSGGRGAQPDRAAAVVAAFKHAYHAYERTCMGQDEYHPLSKRCSNWIGAGLTIVDALPTMMLMGLSDEVTRARNFIGAGLEFGRMNSAISFFETTIRVLGGLISAHDLSGGQGPDSIYLTKAQALGDKLLPAFNTPSGLARAQINLASGATGDFSWTGGASLLAEVATCQMEFKALSARTGDPKYSRASQKAIDVLDRISPPDGLFPIYLSAQAGQFMASKVSLGAMGDSAYEYLLKVWLLTGRKDSQLQRMYVRSMDGVLDRLLVKTDPSQGGHSFLADLENGRLEHKMDHLVCFVPGMLALGVAEGIVSGARAARHSQVAKDIMRTCWESYSLQPSGIGPEVMVFTPGLSPGEPSYKLRPEMIESLFLLWRLTGESQYREWGWEAFQAIERHCRVADGGYAALMDVRRPESREDKMESFFLAETLKYLYLLFSDDSALVISGRRKPGEYFVLNTEAHPIRSWELEE